VTRRAGLVARVAALAVVVVTVAVVVSAAGCVRVRPHERQLLAHPALAQPPWPEAHAALQHVFQIREGSEGAVGAGGGGCGCN